MNTAFQVPVPWYPQDQGLTAGAELLVPTANSQAYVCRRVCGADCAPH